MLIGFILFALVLGSAAWLTVYFDSKKLQKGIDKISEAHEKAKEAGLESQIGEDKSLMEIFIDHGLVTVQWDYNIDSYAAEVVRFNNLKINMLAKDCDSLFYYIKKFYK